MGPTKNIITQARIFCGKWISRPSVWAGRAIEERSKIIHYIWSNNHTYIF